MLLPLLGITETFTVTVEKKINPKVDQKKQPIFVAMGYSGQVATLIFNNGD